MADVVALRKAKEGAQLLEHYSHLLKRTDEVDEYSQLIPLDHLSMLNEVIEASLKPAARADLAKAVAVLFASFKVGDVLEDRPAFTRLMIAELAVYPTDILERAIIQARRTIKWLPSIAEMIAICNELFDERRSQLYIVQRMIGEHRRRWTWRRPARQRQSAKPNASKNVRRICKRSRCEPASVSVMMRRCPATSSSQLAYQTRQSTGQECPSRGKLRLPVARTGQPNTAD